MYIPIMQKIEQVENSLKRLQVPLTIKHIEHELDMLRRVVASEEKRHWELLPNSFPDL